MKNRFGKKLLLISAAALSCAFVIAAVTAVADEPAFEWAMPFEASTTLHSSSASPDGRWVAFIGITVKDKSQAFAGWILDSKSGKSVGIVDVIQTELKDEKLAFITFVEFSSNGKYASVVAKAPGEDDKYKLFLVTLETLKVRKILESENMILAVWGGDKLYISCVKEKIAPALILDPEQEKPVETKNCVAVAAVDPKGQFLVAGGDGEDPTKPVSVSDKGKAFVIIVSSEGKIIRKLGPIEESRTQPIISPDGKYVAYQFDDKKSAETEVGKVLVFASQGQDKWEFKTAGVPVAVTNDRKLVVQEYDKENRFKNVKLIDETGAGKTVAEKVITAAVGGGKLFVVLAATPDKVKAIPLAQ